MKKFVPLAVMAMSMLMLSPAQATNDHPKNLKDCDGTYVGATFKNVTVQDGSSCRLVDSEVTGGVHAKKGAENLYVINTPVGRNVHAMGVTGTVKVGPKNCSFDPAVGNNVMVRKSHNVVICWVTAKNNIMVTGNDGRITVRNSVAGNNIQVVRNLPFVSDGPVKHGHPGTIRVLNNRYDNHLVTEPNSGRTVLRRNNARL